MSALHRSPARHKKATIAAAAALLLGGGALTALPGTAQAAATTVQVTVSTADGTKRLSQEAPLSFGTPQQATNIAINANERHQPMTGVGASITEASASLIAGLPATTRTQLMSELFGGSGIGLNYLRQPFGGTDFVAALPYYSYDDNGTTPDPTLSKFSIARDKEKIIPLLNQAKGINPGIRFMATPWSAPAWMKDNGSLNGGKLKTEYYDEYANYLVKAIQAYAAEGVPIEDLTVQNEAELGTSYPSMIMTSAEQAEFLKVLDPKLAAAGLGTNLFAFDHNWDHPSYPLDVFSRTSGLWRLAGAAFHCYAGSPEAQQQVINAGKRVFMTECSGSDTTNTYADTLEWHAENLVVRSLRSGSETVIDWNLALNSSGGPHFGNCQNRCNGVVEVNGSSYTKNAEYYVLGHLGKYVKRGAVRIGSNSGASGGLQNVAFENPDGSRAVYVVNAGSSTSTFSVTESGTSFGYSLPAGAIATFTWPGSPTGGTGTIDPSAWYELVNVNSGMCVDQRDGATADGTAVQQWECGTGAENVQWQLTPTDGGYSRITSRKAAATNQVIDVTDRSTVDGAKIQTWAWTGTGGPNQQWRPEAVSGGYRFVNRNSGKCLDVTGHSTVNGTQLQQWTCAAGSTAQTFRLVKK
ncbi:RICIN domain-containing protein [Streptomyces formicae]|uniref:RICIN domain-containing protein n=1 Tax=Streptomyces formicae TaxID=1616117 RepID=A0ABY3WHU9_9ACTN|nr:RICIN domain-containing protein [Streptomyces formicae]UNM12153.1 RICIN domain-containing protein [Streptomyces formicae]